MQPSDPGAPSPVTDPQPAPAPGPAMASHVGDQFARQLAAKDAVALKDLLRSDVNFRALTPGRFWEPTGVDAIVDDTLLGTWFAGDRQVTEILAIETDNVGPLCRVGYRFKVASAGSEFLLEQQAFFETDGEKISWLRIMCTGFLPL